MNKQKLYSWISASRPRTLPLTLSTIVLGAFLAYSYGVLRWDLTILALITTLFLQILSNLANDYGDSSHHVDNAQRKGPSRMVQSGKIKPEEMRKGIWVVAGVALSAGIPLVILGTEGSSVFVTALFFLLGLAAIAAAIKYTVGSNPYGYIGLGDIFVFVFFGLAGVKGSFFLITRQWDPAILLPAAATGFLSAAVLNLNNMRDRENDALSGKHTLAVKLGIRGAKWYHLALIASSVVLGLTYMLINYHSPFQMLFLITIPMLWMHVYQVFKNTLPEKLDPYLRKLALTSLLFSVSFGIGLIL